jgi:hypothetical protein
MTTPTTAQRKRVKSQAHIVVMPAADVKEVRKLLGLTIAAFAAGVRLSNPWAERLERDGANEFERLALVGFVMSLRKDLPLPQFMAALQLLERYAPVQHELTILA